jgi:hypothetical protein
MTEELYWSLELDKKYLPGQWVVKYDPNRLDDLKKWQYSWLVDSVNRLNPSLVIDAGCGTNKWKDKIKNLVGFDASPFPKIDFQSTILEAAFEENSADVLLLLGSLQFFNRDYIEQNLLKSLSWVKPNGLIYVRAIKKWDGYSQEQLLKMFKNHYFWDEDDVNYFTDKFNLTLIDGVHTVQKQSLDKSNGRNPFRLYWIWRKN